MPEPKLDLVGSSLADRPVEQPQEQISRVGEAPRFIDAGSDGVEETATDARFARGREARYSQKHQIEAGVTCPRVVEIHDGREATANLEHVAGMHVCVHDVSSLKLMRFERASDLFDSQRDTSSSAVVIMKRLVEAEPGATVLDAGRSAEQVHDVRI